MSAEQFAELVSVLENLRAPASDSNKRRSTRMELQAQVPLSFIYDDQPAMPCVVSIRDFSARGLGILYETPLPVGQQFTVEFRRLKGSSISLLCTVMHSRKLPEGKYRVGAEFTCVLQDPPNQKSGSNPKELDRIQKSVLS